METSYLNLIVTIGLTGEQEEEEEEEEEEEIGHIQSGSVG